MIAVMGIIFFLSHQPGSSLHFSLPPGADKLGHALLYGLLAAAALPALAPSRRRPTWRTGILVVLVCLLYGVSDELHQAMVPGRDPSLGDLIADTAGAAAVVVLWLWTVAAWPASAS